MIENSRIYIPFLSRFYNSALPKIMSWFPNSQLCKNSENTAFVQNWQHFSILEFLNNVRSPPPPFQSTNPVIQHVGAKKPENFYSSCFFLPILRT